MFASEEPALLVDAIMFVVGRTILKDWISCVRPQSHGIGLKSIGRFDLVLYSSSSNFLTVAGGCARC